MDDYSFGHSEHELARLIRQGALYAPITREVFLRAGLKAGMHVLDVGCGAGDVSLLAADMVGPTGSVLAVDRAPEAIATTRKRAHDAGIGWIACETHDLGTLALPPRFDAVVGRLVLCYVPERVDLLRRLTLTLNPGGVLAFVEMDVSAAGAVPVSPLFQQVNHWVTATMQRGGFEPDMGGKLYATFREAGLEADLAAFAITGGGPAAKPITYLEDVVRSLQPIMEKAGVASADDIADLGARLRAEPDVERRTFYLPRLTGAWARAPAA